MRPLRMFCLSFVLVGTVGACRDSSIPVEPPVQAESSEAAPLAGEIVDDFVAIDLGSLAGPGGSSIATAINVNGEVIGFSETPDGSRHAFLWRSGTLIDLGTLGGDLSEPTAINSQGQVVGWSDTGGGTGERHAFLWEDGSMLDLGTLGGSLSQAVDINDQGQIVGGATRTAIEMSGRLFEFVGAFLWEEGGMRDLGTLGSPETSAIATSINGQSHVTGISLTGTSPSSSGFGHGFLWRGEMLDLGLLEFRLRSRGRTPTEFVDPLNFGLDNLPLINDLDEVLLPIPNESGSSGAALWRDGVLNALGTLPGGSTTVHADLNDTGEVTGSSGALAFLWSLGMLMDLGTLGESSRGLALNDAGDVAGTSRGDFETTPTLTTAAGQIINLGTLGGAHGDAVDVNDSRHVVGWSQTTEGIGRATLWRPLTPVEQLDQTTAVVTDLQTAGTINGGQAKALVNKLNVATAMLNDGKETPAVNQLQAFVNQVEALIEGGVLTPEEGQPLIDAAQAVIDELTA